MPLGLEFTWPPSSSGTGWIVSWKFASAKLAVHVCAVLAVTWIAVLMLVEHPDHPAKTLPSAGVAVNVTDAPCPTCVVWDSHDGPQLISPTFVVTVPVPVPPFPAVMLTTGTRVSVHALCRLAPDIETVVEAPLPAQLPDHPPIVNPPWTSAPSETCCPASYVPVHPAPVPVQLTICPAGLIALTLAAPAGVTVTARLYCSAEKFAVQVLLPSIVTPV
jgi:hypothetical protein